MVSSMMTAQIIEVTGNDGEEITDGYVFNTDQLNTYIPLHVKNVTEETIYVKLRMDQVINGANMDWLDEDLGGVQFCFGELCYNEVAAGDIVPNDIEAADILPGMTNPDGDKFLNYYVGDEVGQPVEYHMSFRQYNAANEPIGDEPLLRFKYIYEPTASVTDFANLQNIGINVKNTVVKSTFDVDATVAAKLELFDVTGKQVSTTAVSSGANAIDLSGLNAAVYIARFTTEDNKTSQIRIVKN